jgi:YgiT-type zinc finger domain-containing protein
MSKLEECPLCGNEIILKNETFSKKYKNVDITATVELEYCENCSEGFLDYKTSKLLESLMQEEKNKVDRG